MESKKKKMKDNYLKSLSASTFLSNSIYAPACVRSCSEKMIRRWRNWIDEINEWKSRQNMKMKRRNTSGSAKVVKEVDKLTHTPNEKRTYRIRKEPNMKRRDFCGRLQKICKTIKYRSYKIIISFSFLIINSTVATGGRYSSGTQEERNKNTCTRVPKRARRCNARIKEISFNH